MLLDVDPGVGGRLPGHVELHADLVELERRQLTGDERPRGPVQDLDVVIERVTGRDGDGVPEVVRVVALVVVADARVCADDGGSLVDPIGVDLRGDQRRAVSERPGVEDRRELAQHPELLHAPHACAHFRFVAAQSLREHGVRPRLERKVPLDCVQQLAVGVFELVDVQLAGLRLLEERFFAHAHVLHRAEADRTRQITARSRVRPAPCLRSRSHPAGRRARGPLGASRGRGTP